MFSTNKPDVFRDTHPYLNKVPFYSKDTIEDKALYNSRIALSTVRSILNLIFWRRSSTCITLLEGNSAIHLHFSLLYKKLENWLLLAFSPVVWYRDTEDSMVWHFIVITLFISFTAGHIFFKVQWIHTNSKSHRNFHQECKLYNDVFFHH